MAIFDITQVALERAISGATLRNSVLTNNVANANTAGFMPSDVDFHGALAAALESGTDPTAAEAAQSTAQAVVRADGSGVDAEAEQAKLAKNGLELNALVSVAGARIDILRSAMGSR